LTHTSLIRLNYQAAFAQISGFPLDALRLQMLFQITQILQVGRATLLRLHSLNESLDSRIDFQPLTQAQISVVGLSRRRTAVTLKRALRRGLAAAAELCWQGNKQVQPTFGKSSGSWKTLTLVCKIEAVAGPNRQER
jgi:hypothetical protein